MIFDLSFRQQNMYFYFDAQVTQNYCTWNIDTVFFEFWRMYEPQKMRKYIVAASLRICRCNVDKQHGGEVYYKLFDWDIGKSNRNFITSDTMRSKNE